MLQALRVTGMILADGAVERIAPPTRVYTAGDDTVVLPEAQQAFAARLKHGERVVVPGARHEILLELNHEEVFADVLGWIEEKLSF